MAVNLKTLTANIPQANLESFVFTVYGRPKVGKSSLFYKVVKAHYNGDLSKGLLLAFEKGYQALKGVYAQDMTKFEDFVSVTDQLILNRKDLPFRLVAIDTVDQMYKMATDYILKRETINMRKQLKDIKDIPYGGGYNMVADVVYEQIDRLLKAGIGLFFITHEKDRKMEMRDGGSYDKTTVSLPARARDLVINMSDFVIFIDNVRSTDELTGVTTNQRYIYFRAPQGEDIEAGSRFANIVDKVEYDEYKFLEAFENAVLNEVGSNTDIDKLKQEQMQKRESEAAEYVDHEKLSTPEALIETLNVKVKELSAVDRKSVSAEFKEILGGTANYTTVSDMYLLQECLNVVNKLQG